MAEVNVQKKRSDERSQRLERRRHPLGYRDEFPTLWRSPFETLSTSPFGLMRRLTEEMDRMFTGNWPGLREGEVGEWLPAVEITERDGKILVRADLPGINKDDVKVELNDGILTIEGERKQEHEEESQGFRRSERRYGRFSRSIPLPEGANLDQARAQFNNGVLEVSVPVPESQRRRSIPIEAGSERKEAVSESAGRQAQSKAV
jgi:HSP20 family protein